MEKRIGTLLAFPHSDDACMACTHLLSLGLLPEPLLLVTVFSFSYHVVKNLRAYVPRVLAPMVRVAEDTQFCENLGMLYRSLGCRDRRLGPPGSARYSRVVRSVQRRLLAVVRRLRCKFVVCPFPNASAESVHSHHTAVYEAAAAAVAQVEGTELLLVDDQPYSRMPIDARIKVNAVEYVPCVIRLSETDLRRKVEMMRKIYVSQMRPSYIESVAKPAPNDVSMCHSESLWIPAESMSNVRQLQRYA